MNPAIEAFSEKAIPCRLREYLVLDLEPDLALGIRNLLASRGIEIILNEE